MTSHLISSQNKIYEGNLFIKGVFKKDCKRMEDKWEEEILLNTVVQKSKVYDKLPIIFTSLENWPKKTNLECCFCRRLYKTIPWFEPQYIEPVSVGDVGNTISNTDMKSQVNKKKFHILTKYNFCTPNCCQAHINLHVKDLASKKNKTKMLLFIYEIFTQDNIKEILPSDDPSCLIKCGGKVSDAEYDIKIKNLGLFYTKSPSIKYELLCNELWSKMTV
jgi:hypothetical protein